VHYKIMGIEPGQDMFTSTLLNPTEEIGLNVESILMVNLFLIIYVLW